METGAEMAGRSLGLIQGEGEKFRGKRGLGGMRANSLEDFEGLLCHACQRHWPVSWRHCVTFEEFKFENDMRSLVV